MEFPATIIDQMGRCITLMQRPRRIVSLVPSQTELLAHLGLADEVVGITKFCIYPNDWYRNKTRVGGTKQYHFDKIAALSPDLIIGNKEENDQQQIEQLMQHYPVWMSDINTLPDALEMIRSIGALTEKSAEANVLAEEIETKFNALAFTENHTPKKAAYFIWRDPWMVAGHSTFITDMLKRCGLTNVFCNESSRYPVITAQQLEVAAPDLLLFSSEPYPFKEEHMNELRSFCPQAKLMLVDGEAFSWYGSRLLHSPSYFTQLFDHYFKSL